MSNWPAIRVITNAEIGRCKKHILAPSHWIPTHKLEECDPDCRMEVDAELRARIARAEKARADFDANEKREREELIQRIREKHEGRQQP